MTIPWVVGYPFIVGVSLSRVDDGLMNKMIGDVVATCCRRRLGIEQWSVTVL